MLDLRAPQGALKAFPVTPQYPVLTQRPVPQGLHLPHRTHSQVCSGLRALTTTCPSVSPSCSSTSVKLPPGCTFSHRFPPQGLRTHCSLCFTRCSLCMAHTFTSFESLLGVIVSLILPSLSCLNCSPAPRHPIPPDPGFPITLLCCFSS